MDVSVTDHTIRIVVVTPHGRVDAFNASELRGRLEALLGESVTKFVLDLSEVPFLDSAGMAVLVSILKRARQQGGDVRLVWPQQEAAQRILRLTKFDRVFQMADTAEAALQNF